MQRIPLALALCALGAAAPTSAAPYAPRVGERHPDFILPRVGDGRPVALSHFRGKKLLLIHFASW